MGRNTKVFGAVGLGAIVSAAWPVAGASAQVSPGSDPVGPVRASRLDPILDVPPDDRDQLISMLNDRYEAAVAGGEIAPGAGVARPFTAENVDVVEIPNPRPRAGGPLVMVVPAGTSVAADGSMTPPQTPGSFALQAQGNWGEESGAHHSCIVDYFGDWNNWAKNCSTWSWYKLAESNSSNDYWMVHAESALFNSGGYMRTKSGHHQSKTSNSSAGQREFRPLSGQSSGCKSVNVNVSGSLAGVGIGTSFPIMEHCDRIDPINPNGDPRSYMGVKYTGPDDGAVQARELGSTQVFRVSPNNNAIQLTMHHGVSVGCYDNWCTGCAG